MFQICWILNSEILIVFRNIFYESRANKRAHKNKSANLIEREKVDLMSNSLYRIDNCFCVIGA